jgi:hypothetical protein
MKQLKEWWQAELRQAGYDPVAPRRAPRRAPLALVDLAVQEVASRACHLPGFWDRLVGFFAWN